MQILPSTKYTPTKLTKAFKILPKWRNFAKSGHTGIERTCVCKEARERERDRWNESTILNLGNCAGDSHQQIRFSFAWLNLL